MQVSCKAALPIHLRYYIDVPIFTLAHIGISEHFTQYHVYWNWYHWRGIVEGHHFVNYKMLLNAPSSPSPVYSILNCIRNAP